MDNIDFLETNSTLSFESYIENDKSDDEIYFDNLNNDDKGNYIKDIYFRIKKIFEQRFDLLDSNTDDIIIEDFIFDNIYKYIGMLSFFMFYFLITN